MADFNWAQYDDLLDVVVHGGGTMGDTVQEVRASSSRVYPSFGAFVATRYGVVGSPASSAVHPGVRRGVRREKLDSQASQEGSLGSDSLRITSVNPYSSYERLLATTMERILRYTYTNSLHP